MITVHPITYDDRGEPVIGETVAQIEGTTITYEADVRDNRCNQEGILRLDEGNKDGGYP